MKLKDFKPGDKVMILNDYSRYKDIIYEVKGTYPFIKAVMIWDLTRNYEFPMKPKRLRKLSPLELELL